MGMDEDEEIGLDEEISNPSGKSESNGLGAWLVLIAIILVVTFVSWPMLMRQKKAADRTRAIGNLKQIGLALLEFDHEFGRFPDGTTVEKVKRIPGMDQDLSGQSSNALFRQLIAFGIKSEAIFYCVHPEGIHEGDGDFSRGRALEAGEVGYSYVAGLNTGMNPGISVAMTPMKIGTEMFWAEPYGGKAAILRLDNSVEAPPIGSDGRVSVGDGKRLFDTGADTVWGEGFEMDLRHPERGR